MTSWVVTAAGIYMAGYRMCGEMFIAAGATYAGEDGPWPCHQPSCGPPRAGPLVACHLPSCGPPRAGPLVACHLPSYRPPRAGPLVVPATDNTEIRFTLRNEHVRVFVCRGSGEEK